MQVELGEFAAHSPVKNKGRRGALLAQRFFGCLEVGEQAAVGRRDVHVAHHDVGGELGSAHQKARGATVLDEDALDALAVVKLNALALGKRYERFGDGDHSAEGNKGSEAKFKVRNHRQRARSLVGRRAVVGRKAVKELHHFGAAKALGVNRVHGLRQLQAGQSRQGRQRIAPQVGRGFVKGALQKQSFGGLILAAGQVEVGAHMGCGLAQDALGFGGKFRGVTVGSQAGAVVPEVAALLGLFEVVEVVARILAAEREELVDQKRKGKE